MQTYIKNTVREEISMIKLYLVALNRCVEGAGLADFKIAQVFLF